MLTILGYPHAADGSGYYRFYLPFEHLGEHTEHRVVLPEPGWSFAPDDDQLAAFDLIVGQRMCGSDGVSLWNRWASQATLVYEVDDDILRPHPALPQYAGEGETIRHCLRIADLVTCSTEVLAAQLRPHNPNVRVLPNVVDATLLDYERPRRERLTVGWAGGYTHHDDLAMVADVLRDLDADIHLIGEDYTTLLGRECRHTPWQPVQDYYRAIDFDIGLAPLTVSPFNDCKSPIKALEYAALGIPVVASDVPAYRDFVVDGVTGYLVSGEDEWRTRLDELLADEAMRDELGTNARRHAQDWTIQEHWRLWRTAYETVSALTTPRRSTLKCLTSPLR